jgi:hypothetical protein
VGQAIKYKFAFCATREAEEKRSFDSILNFQIFYQRSEVSVAHSKVTVVS